MECFRRTWAEIDLSALTKNYRAISALNDGAPVFPVVKADAYGHGAPQSACTLEKAGVSTFAVSNIAEAMELKNHGINGDILILGYTPPQEAATLSRCQLLQSVFSLEYAIALNEEAKKQQTGNIRAHLKLDTGMGRIGFSCRTEPAAGLADAEAALQLPYLQYEGVFTHFAVSDSLSAPDRTFTRQQYTLFCRAVEALEGRGYRLGIRHCSNSAAILTEKEMRLDAVRAGIILYGLSPSEEVPPGKAFEPVMSLYSVVSEVKEIQPGETVSYGRTFCADRPTIIATVSAGYADGIPRSLSNRGQVSIRGKRAPIVGRICMDQFCADVTGIEGVRMGDAVTIFGKNLSVDEVARQAQTISYEIVCGISKRVPRIFISEEEEQKK